MELYRTSRDTPALDYYFTGAIGINSNYFFFIFTIFYYYIFIFFKNCGGFIKCIFFEKLCEFSLHLYIIFKL